MVVCVPVAPRTQKLRVVSDVCGLEFVHESTEKFVFIYLQIFELFRGDRSYVSRAAYGRCSQVHLVQAYWKD